MIAFSIICNWISRFISCSKTSLPVSVLTVLHSLRNPFEMTVDTVYKEIMKIYVSMYLGENSIEPFLVVVVDTMIYSKNRSPTKRKAYNR